jgi:hypothetical protein
MKKSEVVQASNPVRNPTQHEGGFPRRQISYGSLLWAGENAIFKEHRQVVEHVIEVITTTPTMLCELAGEVAVKQKKFIVKDDIFF